MAEFGPEYVASMREALSDFYQGVADFSKAQGVAPATGSQAASEQATFPRPESLVTGWSIAAQLIESGGEHVTAFVKTITEPMEPIACWTCVRCMLESCALAAWLLDPSIDAHTRIRRVFALRYEGLEQQLKFARVIGRSDEELKHQEDHIGDVEKVAVNLGYRRVVDSQGTRIGIGQRMPPATEVIKLMLDKEVMYRLLSAVAHGHSWAILQLGFKPVADRDNALRIGGVQARGFEKTAYVKGLAYLGLGAAESWAKPLWYQCRYFGWDEAWLTLLLERTFDKIEATPAVRFWKGTSS